MLSQMYDIVHFLSVHRELIVEGITVYIAYKIFIVNIQFHVGYCLFLGSF